MFKGLHQLLHKPTKPTEVVHKGPLVIPVHTAETLLGTEKRQQHLKNIKALLNLPPKFYDNLYGSVMERFAEYVQNLPQTQYGAFSNMGGFLDHGIERAARALSLCLAYFHPQDKVFHDVSPKEALWIYAIYTAALFLDLGKLAVKYHITMCDKTGAQIKIWSPYGKSMLEHGTHYKYDFIKENRDNLGRLVTALLARQILTEATKDLDAGSGGFSWIASDPDVLEAWLSMLNTEGRPMGTFMSIIPLADAQIIEGIFGAGKPFKEPITKPFAGTLFDTTATTTATTGMEDSGALTAGLEGGEAFLRWLRTGLSSGAISANELSSQLQIVREGVLMSSEIFKAFVSANPHYKNPDSIEQQFARLLELYVEPIGPLQSRYHLKGGVFAQSRQQWMLVNNPHILYSSGKLPPINSNLVKLASQNAVAAPPPRQKTTATEQVTPHRQ